MLRAQQIAKSILPASWYALLRKSSERWMIQCTECKSERSYWSIGGIRWGAATVAKRIEAECTTCNKKVWARVYYRDPVTDAHNEQSQSNT